MLPFFRTASVWCGLSRDKLEPDNPWLQCWHPATGLVAGVAHDDAGYGAGTHRSEQAEGFRPRRFRLQNVRGRGFWIGPRGVFDTF